MRIPGWLVVLFSLVACAACGEPAPGPSYARPAITMPTPFPSKRAVEELALAGAKPLPHREVATASRWRVEALPESTPIEARFPGVTFTKELRCVARELGRLDVSVGTGAPDERLQRFIVAACGLSSSDIGSQSWKLSLPPGTSDDAVVDAFAKSAEVAEPMKGRPSGAWITRKDDKAVLTLVSGTAERAVTATLADASGRVTVEGTSSSELLRAKINRGRDGTADCERDPTVARPAYRFACALAPSDPWAWIEVLDQRHESSAFMISEALVIARRDLTTALELGSSEPESTDGPAKIVIFDRLNRARRAARLDHVTLAEKQSATNASVALPIFRALTDRNYSVADEIARGLVAGWDIGHGMIREGEFFGALLTGAKSAESWLDSALDTPLGRDVLLGAHAKEIAIGIAPGGSVGGLGVVVTTYDFFGRQDARMNEGAVYQRLAKLRAAMKLPPATSLPEMPILDAEIARMNEGRRNPRDVTGVVLFRETRALRRPLLGYLAVAHDLGRMTIPNPLLAPGPLALRVAVTPYRPEGYPWGFYMVFIIASAPEE